MGRHIARIVSGMARQIIQMVRTDAQFFTFDSHAYINCRRHVFKNYVSKLGPPSQHISGNSKDSGCNGLFSCSFFLFTYLVSWRNSRCDIWIAATYES